MKVTTVTTSRIELSAEEKNTVNGMMNFINDIDTDVWDSLSKQWQDNLSNVYDICYALSHHGDADG